MTNFHPWSILSNDFPLFLKILAIHTERMISSLIHLDQAGFIKGHASPSLFILALEPNEPGGRLQLPIFLSHPFKPFNLSFAFQFCPLLLEATRYEMSWNNHQDSLWSEFWFQGFPPPEIHQGYQKMGSLTYFMLGQSASDYNEYLDYYFLYQLCYLMFFLIGFRT